MRIHKLRETPSKFYNTPKSNSHANKQDHNVFLVLARIPYSCGGLYKVGSFRNLPFALYISGY